MRRIGFSVFLLAISACTVTDPPEAFLDGEHPPGLAVFPPFVDQEVALEIPAFAYCWEVRPAPRRCREAEPPFAEYGLRLAAPGPLRLTRLTPPEGWSFSADAENASTADGNPSPLEVTGQEDLLVVLPGAGTWNVVLSGEGPQGDADYAFVVVVGGGS